MSKFKVGDKVQVVSLIEDSGIVKVGDTGVVVNIEECEYPIRLKINGQTDYGFAEEELMLLSEEDQYIEEKFTVICNSCGSRNVVINQDFDYDYEENIYPTGNYYLKCVDCGETSENY